MNKFLKLSLPLFAALLAFTPLHAKPSKALMTRLQEQKATTQSITQLAQDSVNKSYAFYKPQFDELVDLESLIRTGSTQSTYAGLIAPNYAGMFAEAIIKQLTTIAQTLGARDRITFWNAADAYLKQVLAQFVSEHGGTVTAELNNYITAQINLNR